MAMHLHVVFSALAVSGLHLETVEFLNPRSRASMQSAMAQTDLHSEHSMECLEDYAKQLDEIKPGRGAKVLSWHHGVEPLDDRSDLIFAVGQGSTATHSIYLALEDLGQVGVHWETFSRRRSHNEHRAGDGAGWGKLLSEAKTDAACQNAISPEQFKIQIPEDRHFLADVPTPELFFLLFLRYPNAKFVMSTRGETGEAWAKKRMARHASGNGPIQVPCGEKLHHLSVEELVKIYHMQNELVRCAVPKERLFEIDLWYDPDEKRATCMADLADFIGVPRAPHENATVPGADLSTHRVNEEKTGCSSFCATGCHEGDPSKGGVALSDGICTATCSKPRDGVRTCGVGDYYTEGSSWECNGCVGREAEVNGHKWPWGGK